MCVAIWFWTQPCLSLCVHILVHIHHIRILFQLDINCQSYRYRSVKNWHLIESDEYFEILSDAVHRPFVFSGAKSCPSGDNVIHTRPSDIHPTYFYIMSEVFANLTNFQNSHEGIGAKKNAAKIWIKFDKIVWYLNHIWYIRYKMGEISAIFKNDLAMVYLKNRDHYSIPK